MEKRRQAAEDFKASRQKAAEEAPGQEHEDTSILDDLLEKLRNGDSVGRKARRTRPSTASRPGRPLNITTDALVGSGSGNDTADIARDMLARLKSDGFSTLAPVSPTTLSATRRKSRKGESSFMKGLAEGLDKEGDVQQASDHLTDTVDFVGEESTVVGSITDSEAETMITDNL